MPKPRRTLQGYDAAGDYPAGCVLTHLLHQPLRARPRQVLAAQEGLHRGGREAGRQPHARGGGGGLPQLRELLLQEQVPACGVKHGGRNGGQGGVAMLRVQEPVPASKGAAGGTEVGVTGGCQQVGIGTTIR